MERLRSESDGFGVIAVAPSLAGWIGSALKCDGRDIIRR
jgi:hypothetical protein